MFSTDSAGRATARYGGFEFVPSAITVRTSGDKTTHFSPLLTNAGKYNDPVPMVYGTGWLRAPIIFSRNDGNLTHMEVLLGMGPIASVLKIVVNDVEIPLAVPGQDMTSTGWYGIVSYGQRTGSFNLDFQDSNGNPLGDPHGSMATLSVAVPNRISTGVSLPTIEVLLQGLLLNTYDAAGNWKSNEYSNNPSWVILDLVKRCGCPLSELNVGSFAVSADYCQTLISTTDLNGNALQVPRFECNLVLTKRQSAASLVRGIRVASCLMLRYSANGLLELLPETTLADQQPTLPDGSNSIESLNGGWPAYEFSDGSDRFSGILRNPDGSSSVHLTSRSIAECSNRLSVEFQDATNEYQQDSLSVVNSDDSALIGYEISSQSTALGIANFSQATRVLLRQLDKLTKGNLFVQFETSFRALKVRPGDIIALTYLKEGFERTPFRVMKLSPSLNYETVAVVAQLHNDDWYSDDPAVLGGSGRQPGGFGSTPRPLIGTVKRTDANSELQGFDFGLEEQIQVYKDGTAVDRISVSFSQPGKLSANATSIPLVSLAPEIATDSGSLKGGRTYYYAIAAVEATGDEGMLSFTIAARVPDGSQTNSVTLQNLSLPKTAVSFNVYRGRSPQELFRIGQEISLSDTFHDSGFSPIPIGPPDPNFNHANFYYRAEYAGPLQVTTADRFSVSSTDMGATPNAYAGMIVRIVSGLGTGQERSITANSDRTLSVTTAWSIVPDSSSQFAIWEPAWHFAAVATTTPVQFEVPYREGSVLQISGRGANVRNQEGAPELCPITRLALGNDKPDFGVPAQPSFFLDAPGAGSLTLSQIGFTHLDNIGSVTSGTLRLYCWNELLTPSTTFLSNLNESSSTLSVQSAVPNVRVGDVVQLGTELMVVNSIDSTSTKLSVVRGVLGSSVTAHIPGEQLLALTSYVVNSSFAPGFFENRASVNFIHPFRLPDVRVSAAEFFVTNAFGDSQAQSQCYTTTRFGGIRSLSGGQFSMQVSGYLSTQVDATPGLLIEESHAVRDLRASLTSPSSGYTTYVEILQSGQPYCRLQIKPGETLSEPSNPGDEVFIGRDLPPLLEGAKLTLNVTTVLTDASQATATPGRDLTVTIRL